MIYRRNGWLRQDLALWLGRFGREPSDPEASERIGWILWFIGRARDALPRLEHIVDEYVAMDERRVIKSLVRVAKV